MVLDEWVKSVVSTDYMFRFWVFRSPLLPSSLAMAGIEQDKGLEHVSMSDAATCPNVFVYFTGYSYSYEIGSAEADKEGLVFWID